MLDASLLMMPLTGFVAPHDPMWLATLDAMDTELVSDSLVYRYNLSASPTASAATRAPSICTFWYVDALARSGAPSRPGWPSRRCSPTPTTWACTPRRSA